MKKLTILLSMLAIAIAGAFAISLGSSTASAADDPIAMATQLEDLLNNHDAAGAAALFSEDGIVTSLSGTSIGATGRPGIEFFFSGATGDSAFHVEDIGATANGDTATGVVHITDSLAVEAGVDYYTQPYTLTVNNGEITALHLTYDESAPGTLEYLQYSASSDSGEDIPPPDDTNTTMRGNENGTLELETVGDGVVQVSIIGDSGPYQVLQPASIYSGSCDALGSPVSWLAPYVYGNSYTYVSGNLQDWLDGDYAVTVGDSPDDSNVIVSCANIEQGAPPEEVLVTDGPGLPNTGTGGSGSTNFAWLIAALALVGVAFAGAGTLAVRRRS